MGADLFELVFQGKVDEVQARLNGGADVQATHVHWGTVLHCAAFRGNSQMVECLLSRGALPNALDGKGATSLHHAAKEGHSRSVELLLVHGADPDVKEVSTGWSPLALAAKKNNSLCVAALISGGAAWDHAAVDWNALVREVVQGGNPQHAFLNCLLQQRKGGTAVGVAGGAEDALRYAVAQALQIGSLDVACRLIKDGVPICTSDPNVSPLHKAAAAGHVNLVLTLLAAGVDPNVVDKDGRTAAFVAICSAADTDGVVDALLLHGTDANARDKGGNTLLHHAVLRANVTAEVVRHLVMERGAKMDEINAAAQCKLRAGVMGGAWRACPAEGMLGGTAGARRAWAGAQALRGGLDWGARVMAWRRSLGWGVGPVPLAPGA